MPQPQYGVADGEPISLTTIRHDDGRMSSYPPAKFWGNWVEYDGKEWPKRVPRSYQLVPTICFNCESGCGLLAYVDRETGQVRKFEGNPIHPGSRGRNCAKGPATHNQIYDPERILYPLKRVGNRGEGKWKRISWNTAMEEIGSKMRDSRQQRRDGIMYHVGRPGEDHYVNRCITAWGVDGHNSHTNICSAGARLGYYLWSGCDRPSPDHAHAQVILLISAHLETGHYFNPHAQRIIEAQQNGAKIITFDPRLSNTGAKSDVWLPTWPGSEATVLLAIARHLVFSQSYAVDFVRDWVNWRGAIDFFRNKGSSYLKDLNLVDRLRLAPERLEDEHFVLFEQILRDLYDEYTIAKAAEEAQVDESEIFKAAQLVAECNGRLAAHTWRAASIGNLGGWQVARCLFFLNVLTGSVGERGGTALSDWNKFVPKPFRQPPPFQAWNDLQLPDEWPFAHYEMSFLLPHFLEEGRGDIDVYFTRVYNPMWINPDGFLWLKQLTDTAKIKCHVALTPTWNESAWYADYVLPMGHASERHDLMSQETHAGQWIGFRQPVQRVAQENLGRRTQFTYETNPGEVWEEAEFWVQLSDRMDPDGALGIRQWFESPYRPGELISQDEYWGWMFENSVPGLPEVAAEEQLTPLQYMRKYGCFTVKKSNYRPFEQSFHGAAAGVDHYGCIRSSEGTPIAVMVDGVPKVGFNTPSRRLEFVSELLFDWGWTERGYPIPWALKSHVHLSNIDRKRGEMVLLPNFRLPTLIHTRSANAKWLYEISHRNPVWMNPCDAKRIGVDTGELIKVETETGFFVDKVWVTEGVKPGIIAMSHHLGRWRLQDQGGISPGSSSLARIEPGRGRYQLEIIEGAKAYTSSDPDTSRIWWRDVGVHQNLTHAVHPDPVSGAHCWLQKALRVTKADSGCKLGDVFVDVEKSMAVYRHWLAMAKPASRYSPNGIRRPLWLKRPLRPVRESYTLPRQADESADRSEKRPSGQIAADVLA